MTTLADELWANPKIGKISQLHGFRLANKIVNQGGFITDEDLPEIIKVDRSMLLLVRCGGGRFLTTADSVQHFVEIIEEHAVLKAEKDGSEFAGDHIRDISIPV